MKDIDKAIVREVERELHARSTALSHWVTLKVKELVHRFSGNTIPIWPIAFDPTGQYLAAGRLDQVTIWELKTGLSVQPVFGHHGRIYSVAFSDEYPYFATGASDSTAIIWRTDSNKPIRRLTEHQGIVYTVAFSPSGRFLATGSSDQRVIIFDAMTGRPIRRLALHIGSIQSVSFDCHDRYVAVGGSQGITLIYDIKHADVIHRLTKHKGAIWSVAFNHDGLHFATGAEDSSVIVWNLKTGNYRCFSGHTKSILSIAFTREGRHLATASWDGTAAIWDVETGQLVQHLPQHPDAVTSVDFSKNDYFLATASKEGTIRVWETRSWQLLATLYNLNEGFLWMTPSDEVAKSGWFWTNRPELINVIKCYEDGSEAEVLENDEEERKEYIRLYNRQDMVMNRLCNWAEYKREINRLLNRCECLQIENHINSRQHLLTNRKEMK